MRRERSGVHVHVFFMLLLAAWLLPASATAQQATTFNSGKVSATLGVREWLTTGHNEWNFDGPVQLLASSPRAQVNVLSDLRWRGVDSAVTELYGDLFLGRFGVLGSLGFGKIDDGVLIDDDFTRSNREGRFSHTRSSVGDDGLFRWNLDLAVRAVEWGRPLFGDRTGSTGSVDGLLGYQYWHEKYVAFGLTGFGCATATVGTNNCASFAASTASPSIKVISQDYTWHMPRLGARARVPVIGGLSLSGGALVSPLVWYSMEDVHHLRTDLKHNPSFSSRSENGWGLELHGAVAYTLWKGLAAEAGYRYARIDSGQGSKFTHGLTSTTMDTLNNSTFERYGPHIAVEYRW